ncbi:LacI family DNA-binding transcriptional regulator [Paenibacillus eucommiae]|uniref:LacI family transcriptional regulator n=1 Tax=Paenibacillus eucommiae TaxID=1355755 RepID=A0ABS4J6Y0_9BACL|nr:LacI family DNA-binding transcriptional regulator [Paenibacillus eucommiae]MBP1995588.1 LacI family transcriptional regulator [Paenibacillus eucommiae]
MISSKDVAKRARVSQPTVSRVLNNPDSVKAETRNRVLEAMEELGYYPNLIARSLVTNTTRTIALVSGTLKNGFFAETTDSIVHSAKSKGYKTITYFEDEDEVPDFFDSVMGFKVDGLLLSLIKLDDPVLERIKKTKIPCMFFNRKPRHGGNFVVLDNQLAAKMLTQHLLELGHQRIAYISGRTDVSTFLDRKLGFEQTMAEANVNLIPEMIHFIGTSSNEVEEATVKLLAMDPPPTAIMCVTDTIALICMDIIMSRGLRVPEDISIAGFDDIRLSSHQAIQLTTVGSSDMQTMGEIAADNLIELIELSEVNAEPRQILLQPVLNVRKTTAALS